MRAIVDKGNGKHVYVATGLDDRVGVGDLNGCLASNQTLPSERVTSVGDRDVHRKRLGAAVKGDRHCHRHMKYLDETGNLSAISSRRASGRKALEIRRAGGIRLSRRNRRTSYVFRVCGSRDAIQAATESTASAAGRRAGH